MKNNKIILALAALFIVLAGCNDDFLAEKRDLAGVNEEVFTEPILATAYVDYIYGMFLPANNAQAPTWNLATNSDDFTKTTEELGGQTNWNKEWANVSYLNSHALSYFGGKLTGSVSNTPYTRIKEINLFLTNVDKYGMADNIKKPLKGQLYFWRAWQYFDLVRLYGGVPLVLMPQDPIISDDGETEVQRSSTSLSIEQICADLDTAISLLPGKYASTTDWGRITSGAAAALKGRVLLTWASPLFNRSDDVTRWKRAYDANLAAKTLLEANGFGLFTTGGTAKGVAWGNMWFTEGGNPEAVLSYGFNNSTTGNVQKNSGWEQAVRSKTLAGGGSISPTKQMVDAFPMKDGKMAGASKYQYDPQVFFKDRDPRFYKTFVYNGALWPYAGLATYRQWTYKWYTPADLATKVDLKVPTASTEIAGANSTGIYLCKATSPSANNTLDGFKYSGTDFMELRFAEVVLNLAESAIGINNLTEGLAGIASIRQRAGIENLDGSYGLSAAVSRDQLFVAVLNERKIEFAYEGKRFFDLRRWMLFDATSPVAIRLGLQNETLNGTRRTGYFITVKKADGTNYSAAAGAAKDPMLKTATAAAPVIDREPAVLPTGFTNFDGYLEYLYKNHFTITVKDDIDPTSPANWKFKWYDQYYFFGFNQSILSGSPYLEQTQGWDSLTGKNSFDPLL
ncbi:RagB/SusD family nutrient uptake outer membrane protein [Arcticibacter eurypsychrophilus]|uniref:RagB/SusD family nutrient uptake outer membrane protein n=1 Tax=Arcticibacter eurypsychrophilus TaxID=1434752 RepID=UPI00084DE82D|nr:RagB/SusD family nutrient uptake outer membrane protein [Arcticibacter eurypsychrophilus]